MISLISFTRIFWNGHWIMELQTFLALNWFLLIPKLAKSLKPIEQLPKLKKKKKKKKDRLWLQYLPLLHPLHYEKSSLSDCFNRISTLNKMLRLALVTKLFWLSFWILQAELSGHSAKRQEAKSKARTLNLPFVWHLILFLLTILNVLNNMDYTVPCFLSITSL